MVHERRTFRSKAKSQPRDSVWANEKWGGDMGWWGPIAWVNIDLRCWVALFKWHARVMAQNSIQSHWDLVLGVPLETAVGGDGGGWYGIENELMVVVLVCN